MEERYALALAIVPEEDVAGDLFMEAADEADLIRRAERWRSRHGLAPLEGRPPLPALTADQRAHAAHLARRAAVRRRMKRGLTVGAAALVALALLLVRRPASDPSTLAVDPVYEGDSVAISDQAGGLQVLVYRVEATPGAVTLWWAVSGSDASAKANRLTPEIALTVSPSTVWTPPMGTEVTVQRNYRVLGKSTYRLFAPLRADAAFLRVREGDEVKDGWTLAVPLVRTDTAPADRTLTVDREAAHGLYVFRLFNLTVGPHHTGVRYLADFAEPHTFLAMESSGVILLPHGNWPARDLAPAEVHAVFDPLPAGAEHLTVIFSPRGWRPDEGRVIPFFDTMGAGWTASQWKFVEGGRLEATITGDPTVFLTGGAIQEINTTHVGEARVEYLGMAPDGFRRWRILSDEFGASAPDDLRLTLRFTRLIPPVLQLPLNLNDLD